eukprot:TRINITY_DN29462_c0_g1_i1.p1 TRINITY_DN29462_c0_g1~~TRINITY_DN29462_c0_g1_i1.p1  ORF type:complete len:201 (-),score=93.28 TRINITY_DN29462_c0_g1_i1:373-975(-)
MDIARYDINASWRTGALNAKDEGNGRLVSIGINVGDDSSSSDSTSSSSSSSSFSNSSSFNLRSTAFRKSLLGQAKDTVSALGLQYLEQSVEKEIMFLNYGTQDEEEDDSDEETDLEPLTVEGLEARKTLLVNTVAKEKVESNKMVWVRMILETEMALKQLRQQIAQDDKEKQERWKEGVHQRWSVGGRKWSQDEDEGKDE